MEVMNQPQFAPGGAPFCNSRAPAHPGLEATNLPAVLGPAGASRPKAPRCCRCGSVPPPAPDQAPDQPCCHVHSSPRWPRTARWWRRRRRRRPGRMPRRPRRPPARRRRRRWRSETRRRRRAARRLRAGAASSARVRCFGTRRGTRRGRRWVSSATTGSATAVGRKPVRVLGPARALTTVCGGGGGPRVALSSPCSLLATFFTNAVCTMLPPL